MATALRCEQQELRCLTLIIEFWRCSFLDNRGSGAYIFKHGWLGRIGGLNGLVELGAWTP